MSNPDGMFDDIISVDRVSPAELRVTSLIAGQAMILSLTPDMGQTTHLTPEAFDDVEHQLRQRIPPLSPMQALTNFVARAVRDGGQIVRDNPERTEEQLVEERTDIVVRVVKDILEWSDRRITETQDKGVKDSPANRVIGRHDCVYAGPDAGEISPEDQERLKQLG